MELIKKNIHMDREKCKAATQITLEDDIIVPDSKPDVDKLIFDKGIIKIEEIKTTADHVTVKGKLCFYLMYLGEEGEQIVNRMEGSIPFEEPIYMNGVQSGDTILLKRELEDLNIGMINPRKLSVQALINMEAFVDELEDIESGVDIHTTTPIECRQKEMELSEIAMQKRDIFRMKQEVELPQNLPNIFTIIWDNLSLGNIEFKPLEDKISVQGEATLFTLYEGEGDEQPIRFFETMVPFSGVVDCYGCRDSMIADIDYQMEHGEVEVKPDFDGEERVLSLDMALDLYIKLYEESQVSILSDVYGIQKDISLGKKEATFKNLLIHNAGKTKVTDKIKIKASSPRVLQICSGNGKVQVEDVTVVPDGVQIDGNVQTQILYVSSEDRTPFYSVKEDIPFTYVLEAPGIDNTCETKIRGCVEQMNVTMLDSEELEAKIILGFSGVVFRNQKEDIISEVSETEIDMDKLNELPSMVAYVAKDGDTLWEIGKKYYIPIAQLKETNGITGELKAGEKILVVKSLEK